MFRKPPCGNLLNIYLWRTSFLFFFYNFFYKCVLISDVFFSNVIKLVSRVSCICWMYLCCICVRLISHWCNAFIEKDWKCKLSRVGMVQDTVSNFISNCFRTVNLIKISFGHFKYSFLSSQIHTCIQYVNSGLICQKPTLFDSLNAQIRNYQI